MALQLTALPAFSDNYIWIIASPGHDGVYIVDPGNAAPVQKYLGEQGLQPQAILLTHHHPDHIGGVDALLRDWPVPVYGPASRISQVTRPLHENDSLEVLGVRFKVLEVPGHTLDHIAYIARPEDDAPLLFCGDTLFAGGCGRLFEGDAPMMFRSLGKLAMLPPETRVYCAHEYTMANLAFATAAEPENEQLRQRREQDQQRLESERITLPSTMSRELETNPFLRCHTDGIRQGLARKNGHPPKDDVEAFSELRQWKDNFRG